MKSNQKLPRSGSESIHRILEHGNDSSVIGIDDELLYSFALKCLDEGLDAFIVLVSFLDGDYAAFGVVTEGMEVVDSFLDVARTYGSDGQLSRPLSPIVIEKAEVI